MLQPRWMRKSLLTTITFACRHAVGKRALERAGEVDPVEAQDHVGGLHRGLRIGPERGRARRAGMQRMIGREGGADFQFGDDLGVEVLGERDARVPAFDAAADAAHQDDRVLRAFEDVRGLLHLVGGGGLDRRRHEAVHIDRRQRLGKLRLLHLRIEVDVDRPHRRGVGDPGRAQDRLARGGGRGRLVVPLGVVAHDRALVAGGVDPVDPRPALGGVDRAGRAEDHDWRAVAPGVEDRHGGVEQADIGMHRGGHRLAGDLGVALRDRDRDLLMQAQDHLRRLVAEIVHDRSRAGRDSSPRD